MTKKVKELENQVKELKKSNSNLEIAAKNWKMVADNETHIRKAYQEENEALMNDSEELVGLKNALLEEYFENTKLDREQKRFVMKEKELSKEKTIATLKIVPSIIQSAVELVSYAKPKQNPTPSTPANTNFCDNMKKETK